jgi:hypothetical protein
VSADPHPDSRPARLRRVAVTAAVLLAGALLALLTDGVAAIVGAGLIGVGAVLAISSVFYEVGRSEDRDRARVAAPGQRAEPSPNGRSEEAPGGGRLAPPREWPPGGRRGRHD